MAKYKITKCLSDPRLEDTEFEAVIIKNMTLLNLVKKIAEDVEGIKTRLDKLETRLDNVENVLKRNNLK
ncbi:MAG: hypothetical protein LBP70_00535 [Mycoplasmataceae bacterium]|jgi:hypothetical protein|nr:hypothetical protein [Mycoplasmataceae bacterium]